MPYIKDDYYVICYHCKMKVYHSTCRRDYVTGKLACKQHCDDSRSSLYTPPVRSDPYPLPGHCLNIPSNGTTYQLGLTWNNISIPFDQLNIPFNQLGSVRTITIYNRNDE